MADEPKEKAPFYEQRWFQGTVAVVGLLGAIWAFSGAPKPWDAATRLSASETVYANTQIIVDTSEAMGAPFGKGTKLDAAVRSIEKYVVPRDQEGLSLRRTGRSCAEAGERLVDFGTGHADDVAEEADALRPEGESSLAYAVIAAIKEFTASDRFEGAISMRQVVIITGAGDDECLGDEAPDEIRRELENSGIDATFKMVSLKPSREERSQLKGFVAALGGHAELDFVDTEEELEEVVAESLPGLTGEAVEEFQLEETEAGETTETETTETTETDATETDEDAVEGGEGVGPAEGEGGEPPPTELEGGSEAGAELAAPAPAEESASAEGAPVLP